MRPRQLRSRDRERYMEAVDEARENVRGLQRVITIPESRMATPFP